MVSDDKTIKFIADSMLGRLSRWLRLIGYDTLYYPHIEDSLLVRISREENRVLLTRDTRLVKVRDLKNFLLLKDNDTFAQLKEVINTYKLQIDKENILSRCPLCNNILIHINKQQARGSVPEYIYDTSDEFKRCPKCGKTYWRGTHREKFRKKLSEILYN